MPNWCEGTLKVRGTCENIKRWLNECVGCIDIALERGDDGELRFTETERPDKTFIEEDCYEMNFEVKDNAYIRGTRRHFIKPGNYRCDNDDDKDCILVLSFKSAWAIDAEPFRMMSEEYSVDFRLYGFERGMCFNQEVVVEGGKVTADREITFDDYEWECPFPWLGG